jgi:hypothetical protein
MSLRTALSRQIAMGTNRPTEAKPPADFWKSKPAPATSRPAPATRKPAPGSRQAEDEEKDKDGRPKRLSFEDYREQVRAADRRQKNAKLDGVYAGVVAGAVGSGKTYNLYKVRGPNGQISYVRGPKNLTSGSKVVVREVWTATGKDWEISYNIPGQIN